MVPDSLDDTALARLGALLIDIDDTILRVKPAFRGDKDSASLHGVVRDYAVREKGLDADAVDATLRRTVAAIRWWCWNDLLAALGLEPEAFWAYARAREAEYTEAVDPRCPDELGRLKAMGVALYVTSNNGRRGILHKLGLAGLGPDRAERLFDGFFGCSEIGHMKWEEAYWRRVVERCARPAGELAVVGDNPVDDRRMPLAAGIGCTFLMLSPGAPEPEPEPGLYVARRFRDIRERLLRSRRSTDRGERGETAIPSGGAGAARSRAMIS